MHPILRILYFQGMTYQETIDYLYQLLPVFHREGKKAYKANLDNTLAICDHLQNPHKKFKSIHVAGTNGKGSTSHFLASILQAAGYKTGLYTSPHLKSFTERVKINGQQIPESKVIEFVENHKNFIETLQPSFFELTVGLAFKYFAEEEVDIAVIEVGLGGRLDSTNIITPELSVITNISFDHTDILGDTLPKIASEKAGIIKPKTPVVISQTQDEITQVFKAKATDENAPIYFADEYYSVESCNIVNDLLRIEIREIEANSEFIVESQLIGNYQSKNIIGVLKAVDILNELNYGIDKTAILAGLSNVINLTTLKGRWQVLQDSPKMVCDIGHNIGGIIENLSNIKNYEYQQLWMILGFVSDKDIDGILSILPPKANYVFCQSNTPRALKVEDLAALAKQKNLTGDIINNVNEAIDFVVQRAEKNDFIYVGGSTFVVAEINKL